MQSEGSVFWIAAVGLVVMGAPGAVRGQNEPHPVAVASSLIDARNAYSGQPTAERVHLSVRARGGALWKEEIVVRLDPGAQGGPRLALELGDLRVVAGGGKIVAAHVRNDLTCCVSEYEGPLTLVALEKLIPPVPIPELGVIAPGGVAGGAEGAAVTSEGWTPYTRRIVWEQAMIDEAKHADIVVVRGRSETTPDGSSLTGTVSAALGVHDGRFRVFRANLGDGDLEFIMEFEPVAVEQAAVWGLSEAGRTRVKQISDLKARPGDVLPGRTVPDLGLIDLEGRAWDMRGLLSGTGPARLDWLAILFVTERGAADGAAAKAALEGLLTRAAENGAGSMVVAFVMPGVGGETRARAAAAAKQWGAGMLWTGSPQQTIERLAPGAGAAIAVVGGDRVLKCVVRLDGRAKEAGRIGAEVAACLKAPAPPPGADQPDR